MRRRKTSLILVAWLVLVIAGMYSAARAADSDWTLEYGPNMTTARMGHGSAVLPDGRVVLFGGHGTGFVSLNTAEVWSPATDSFSQVEMKHSHDFAAVSLLADGRYLLAGGAKDLGGAPGYDAAEIYNPTDNTFTATGTMVRARMNTTAATLANGNVLIVGGWYDNAGATYGELFTPATDTFSATGALTTARALPVVLPTSDGKAVVFGGLGPYGSPMIEQVELYDPASNSFSVLQNTLFIGESGWYIAASNYRPPERMADGRYLLLAYKSTGSASAYALFTFDPATRTFARQSTSPALPDTDTAGLLPPLVDQTAQKAYIVGLVAGASPVRLRLYIVDTNDWSLSTAFTDWILPASHYLGYMSAVLLQDGRILLTGGHSQTGDETNFSPIAKTLFGTIAAADCSYTIAPSERSFGAAGGTGIVTVTASASTCAWTAQSNTPWLSVESGSSGTGDGNVLYAVQTNQSTSADAGTLTIAGTTFTVTRAGQPATTYPPAISASPASVNVGQVKVGSASAPKTVAIGNKGKGDLVIGSTTLSGTNAAEFAVTGDCTTVAPGGSCALAVTLTASSPGKKSAVLTIASNDTKKPTLTVKLSGQAMPPAVKASPASLKMGSVKVGTSSAPKVLTITNRGKSDLVIGSITLSGTNAAEFAVTGECGTIAPGGSCTVTVALTAASAGKKSAVVTIATNDPKKPALAVKVAGEAKPPVISVSPKSLSISPKNTDSPPYTKTFTIKNTGLSDLVIDYLEITGTNRNEFRQTGACATIAQGASCPVSVEFTPMTAGKKSAVLKVFSNDVKKPSLDVKLAGNIAVLAYLTGGTFTDSTGLASVSVTSGEIPSSVKATAPTMAAMAQVPEGLDVSAESGDVNVTAGGAAYSFTLTGEGGFHTTKAEAVTISLPFEPTGIPAGDLADNHKVFVRIYHPDDGSVIDLTGVITISGSTGRITVETRGLPQQFSALVVYNPGMEAVIVEEGAPAPLMMALKASAPAAAASATDWPAKGWCVVYNKTEPALVGAVKNRYPEIAGTPTPDEMRSAVVNLVAKAATAAQNVYEKDGFQAPNLYLAKTAADVCGHAAGTTPRYAIHLKNVGSHFSSDDPGEAIKSGANHYGRIYIENKYLAAGAPILAAADLASGPVGAVIAHEMFHAVQSNYVSLGITEKGYYEGTATVYGTTIANGGVIAVRERPAPNLEFELLSHSLLTPGFPPGYQFDGYRNQDFFAYVGKQYNGGSLDYISGLFEQLHEKVGNIAVPEDYLLYDATDISFTAQFGTSLKEIYLDFLRQRALEHNANSRLGHAGDKVAGFADNLFQTTAVKDYTLNLTDLPSSPDFGTLLKFENIGPYAARAIRIKPLAALAAGDGPTVIVTIKSQAYTSLGTEWSGFTYRSNTIGELQESNVFTSFGKNPGDEIVVIVANVDPLNTLSFEYQVTCGPYITGLSPGTGLAGTSVTITGSGFGATKSGSTVTFNGTSATASSWSDTQIVASVPEGATTGNVVVTVNGITSNGVAFTVSGGEPKAFNFSQQWPKSHFPSGWGFEPDTIDFTANVTGQVLNAKNPQIALKNFYNAPAGKFVEVTNMKRGEVVTVEGAVDIRLSTYTVSPRAPLAKYIYTYSNPKLVRYVKGVLVETYPDMNFRWVVDSTDPYNETDLYVEYDIAVKTYKRKNEDDAFTLDSDVSYPNQQEFHVLIWVTKDVPEWGTP